MELEFFVPPGRGAPVVRVLVPGAVRAGTSSSASRERSCACGAHDADELSHYSAGTSDVEFLFPWGWGELEGIANRTDYDLTQHAKHSGEKLDYFDQATGERYVPHVIEPAAGATRTMMAFLLAAYDEDEVGGEARTVLRLHPRLAPYKVAVLPLSKKDTLTPTARRCSGCSQPHLMCDYDETQSIGRRYRRQDEIGTPYCVTVDFDTLEDRRSPSASGTRPSRCGCPSTTLVEHGDRRALGAADAAGLPRRRRRRQLGSRLVTLRLRLRPQAPPAADGPEGPPRRQGRQPGRDDRCWGCPVPPGFTISTDACRAYMRGGWPEGLDERDRQAGRAPREGDGPQARRPRRPAAGQRPLGRQVLDARDDGHGPRTSGSTTQSVRGPGRRRPATSASPSTPTAGSSRCTAASCSASRATSSTSRSRRPRTAAGVDRRLRRSRPTALAELAEEYKQVVRARRRASRSRRSPRPAARRHRGGVPRWNGAAGRGLPRAASASRHDLGTAVNVQTMVFGNRDDSSGTGVGFTRDPATGENGAYGDFLVNAQGEDVVAGIRNTEDRSTDLKRARSPSIHAELLAIFARLEQHYRDMCDTEFTIEQGKLWMLQTRVGKRTGAAALRMAVDMTKDRRHQALAARRRSAGSRPTTSTRCCTRSSRAEPRHGASPRAWRPRPARRSGKVVLHRRRRGRRRRPGREGHPRADRDHARGRPRHVGVRGHPHRPRRPRLPRRRRGPRVGHPRRGAAPSRSTSGHSSSASATSWCSEGDVISVDGSTGEVVLGEVAPGVRPSRRRSSSVILGWADRHPQGQAGRAGQRRQRPRRHQRPPVRRRGHRAVPHRAHVPRPRTVCRSCAA